MIPVIRHLPCLCAAAVALSIAGCSGSSVDLDEAYGLNDPANQTSAATNVAQIVNDMEKSLRGREVPPTVAIDGAAENLETYQVDQFGDHAAEFEKIAAGIKELKQMADAGKPKTELLEKAGNLKDLSEQLIASSAPAP